MTTSKVSIQLFRSLYRITNKFDKFPASKTLIYRKSLENTSNNFTSDRKSNDYYNQIINKVFTNHTSIFMNISNVSIDKYTDILRSEFQASNDVNNEVNINDRLDAAFTILRKLNNIWSGYTSLIDNKGFINNDGNYLDDDVDIDISKMTKTSVLPSKTLFPGVLLLAHPLLPGPLHRAVILLIEHNQQGSYGIVINKSTNHSVNSGIVNLPDNFKSVFGKKLLFFGGKERRLQCLHDQPLCGGLPIPLCEKPLLAGGDLKDLMKYDDNNKNSFISFYAGCCYWNRNELEKEIDLGCWIPILSQPDKYVKLSYDLAMEEYMNEELDDNDEFDIDNTIPDKKSDKMNKQLHQLNTELNNYDNSDALDSDSDDEESPNIWNIILNDLDPIYKEVSTLPEYTDITSIESIDWK